MIEDQTPVSKDIEIEAVLKKSTKQKKEFSNSLALDFDNLNDCVEALLKKAKGDTGNSRDIKRR